MWDYKPKSHASIYKNPQAAATAWHVGIAGFIYSRRVILVPYRTSDAGSRRERMYPAQRRPSAPSARTLWITTSAWNVNVEWLSVTANAGLSPSLTAAVVMFTLSVNGYTMTNVLYTRWGDMYSLLSINCLSCCVNCRSVLPRLQISVHSFNLGGDNS